MVGVFPAPQAPNAGGELLGKSASFFPVSSSAVLGVLDLTVLRQFLKKFGLQIAHNWCNRFETFSER
jgi:hypothetical protein